MDNSLSQSRQGSVWGAILLIAGCCIGAGMLGLPVLTAVAGFVPSTLLFIVAWLFMMTTGLLLLEVNLWFRGDISIITMANQTLGKVGSAVAWGTFLFLFYSLMVAYLVATGDLSVDFINATTGLTLPSWAGSLIWMLLFGIVIYVGTGAVDHFNRWLMLGLVVSYVVLFYMGASHVKAEHLEYHDWSAALFIIPPMVISFGYHNLIPSLTTYLGHNARRLSYSVVIGSLIPLLVYVLWEGLILGIVPLEGEGGFRQALDQGDMATRALKSAVGAAWIGTVADFLAFFAIITSFIGVALSFVDFVADGLKIKKDMTGKLLLLGLVQLPPFFIAVSYPGLFLSALNYAGAFGAVILFGILPALMVWKGRDLQPAGTKRLVPGGKPVLAIIILFAVAVAALQLAQELGWTA